MCEVILMETNNDKTKKKNTESHFVKQTCLLARRLLQNEIKNSKSSLHALARDDDKKRTMLLDRLIPLKQPMRSRFVKSMYTGLAFKLLPLFTKQSVPPEQDALHTCAQQLRRHFQLHTFCDKEHNLAQIMHEELAAHCGGGGCDHTVAVWGVSKNISKFVEKYPLWMGDVMAECLPTLRTLQELQATEAAQVCITERFVVMVQSLTHIISAAD